MEDMSKNKVMPMNPERKNSVNLSQTILQMLEKSGNKEVEKIVSASRPKRLLTHWKMILVILIPTIGLIAMSSVALDQTLTLHADTIVGIASVKYSGNIGDLVKHLQRERGISALNLKSNETTESLIHYRNGTSSSLYLNGFHYLNTNISSEYTKKSIFQDIVNWRELVDNKNVTAMENIHFYTNIIEDLIRHSSWKLTVPNNKELQKATTANTILLELTDKVGIQRALGSTFLATCSFSDEYLRFFQELEAVGNYLFTMAEKHDRWMEDQFEKHKETMNTINTQIEAEKNAMLSGEPCDSSSLDDSTQWFANMTLYIDILHGIRNRLSNRISDLLNDIMFQAQKDLVMYILIQIIVTFVSMIFTGWYIYCIDVMTLKISNYAKKVKDKTKEVSMAKSQTEQLLYQMLPRKVANILREQGEAPAEYFDQVTVYFSDIVGFTALASRSTPLQIVDMLNNLYSQVDDCIDKFDVYKVETIGDAYVVVSGVPVANGNRHGKEIACMALQIQNLVEHFVVPHYPEEKIRQRIGLNSGSCVAGVVGTKMPRYCLFGDTVNTASRMETSGCGGKIHISKSTKDILDCFHDFVIKERGVIDVKGKGPMTTYWLEDYIPSEITRNNVEFDSVRLNLSSL